MFIIHYLCTTQLQWVQLSLKSHEFEDFRENNEAQCNPKHTLIDTVKITNCSIYDSYKTQTARILHIAN